MVRNPNGASSIYKGSDGDWHGRVTVGVRDDGRPDRRHVRGKTKAVVVGKVRHLEKEREGGRVRRSGVRWTLEAWLNHWLENIAGPGLRETSYSAYRVAIRKHLVPALGGQRLDRLEPEHLERLYRAMLAGGSKAATAHQVHRTARAALGEAVRRGHIVKNAAALARAPRIQLEPVQPYSVSDVRRLLGEASRRRNGARWALALALGLRQGEALALRWRDVDLSAGVMRIEWTMLRPKYEHGCDGSCARKAGFCPRRRRRGPEVGETKSNAGKRVLVLPREVVVLLVSHRQVQQDERAIAMQLWMEGDWIFTSPTGQPINLNTDYREWKAMLKAAGVRDGRLHDARHTAATGLLLLGVPERTTMGIMGWSTTAMAARYQHLTDPIRRDVAERVGEMLWDKPDEDAGED